MRLGSKHWCGRDQAVSLSSNSGDLRSFIHDLLVLDQSAGASVGWRVGNRHAAGGKYNHTVSSADRLCAQVNWALLPSHPLSFGVCFGLFAGLGPFPFSLSTAACLAAEPMIRRALLKDVPTAPVRAPDKSVRIEVFWFVMVDEVIVDSPCHRSPSDGLQREPHVSHDEPCGDHDE